MGEFNEILRLEEKQGWLVRPERQMQGFGMPWIFVGLKTLDLMVSHSLGVIEDRGITMFRFDLTMG